MLLASRALIVEDSRCMLDVLAYLLRAHVGEVLTAATYQAAVEQLEKHADIDLVICDVILPDGNGFQLLEHLGSAPGPAPRLLLVTARWAEDDWHRALSMGAIGYLPKPISLKEIRTAVSMPAKPRVRESRLRSLAVAWVLDPVHRERLICLNLHNISATGALLDTSGPIPIGTEFELEIVLGEGRPVRARGTVVRVQEPSWLDAGGTAVHFDWVESPKRLTEIICDSPHQEPV